MDKNSIKCVKDYIKINKYMLNKIIKNKWQLLLINQMYCQ